MSLRRHARAARYVLAGMLAALPAGAQTVRQAQTVQIGPAGVPALVQPATPGAGLILPGAALTALPALPSLAAQTTAPRAHAASARPAARSAAPAALAARERPADAVRATAQEMTELGARMAEDLRLLSDPLHDANAEASASAGSSLHRALTGETGGRLGALVSMPRGAEDDVAATAKPSALRPTPPHRLRTEAVETVPAPPSEPLTDRFYRYAVGAAFAVGSVAYLLGLAWFAAKLLAPIANAQLDPSGMDPLSEMFR